MMNLGNSQYNEWEYISSGGYFRPVPRRADTSQRLHQRLPGAPRQVYGTHLLPVLSADISVGLGPPAREASFFRGNRRSHSCVTTSDAAQ